MQLERNNFEQIFESAKNASLDERERNSMREQLSYFIAAHPALAPFHIRVIDAMESTLSTNTLFVYGYRHSVAFALLLVVFTGVGTSYAAEGALPDELLYPVKVGITEKIIASLAFSDEEKAAWNVTRTERRLEEAETLAASKRLTLDIAVKLAASIDSSASEYDTKIAMLTKMPQHVAIVADVQSYLEASLVAHEQLLSELGELPDVAEVITPILTSVRSHADNVQKGRRDADEALTVASTTNFQQIAREKKEAAKEGLSQVQSLKSRTAKLGSKVAKKMDSRTIAAQQAIEEGDEELSAGAYRDAYGTFQSVIQTAKETELELGARIRIMQEIGSSFANEDEKDDSDGVTVAASLSASSTVVATTTPEFDKKDNKSGNNEEDDDE